MSQDLHGETADLLEDLRAFNSLDIDAKVAESDYVGEVDIFE